MAVPEEQDTKSPSNNATPTDHHANRTDPGVHSPATSSGTTINHAAQPTAGDSQLPPKPTKGHLEALINKRETLYTEEERAQAWSDAAEMVNRYSDDMIKRWNKEIDTYLVYAGLFSAILTAFNVQSYPLLQPYTPDPAVEALLRISAQLSSFSVSPGFINSTTPSPASDIAAGNVADQSSTPRSAIWLNALWFSSLILSLSSASIGIMVKQWLNEYSSGVYGTSRESARLRQYRLNGLVKWRVADIVMTTPVLLQFSLALFLSGLLVLLWPLNRDVAILASVLIGALAIFTLSVTLLPLFWANCAFISPQTLALYSICERGLFYPLRRLRYRLLGAPASQYLLGTKFLNVRQALSPRFRRLLSRAMYWAKYVGGDYSSKPLTWRGQEHIKSYYQGNTLDCDMLLTAYNATLHPVTLSVAAVCLLECEPREVVTYFSKLNESATDQFATPTWSPGPGGWSPPLSRRIKTPPMLWVNVILCAVHCEETKAWQPIHIDELRRIRSQATRYASADTLTVRDTAGLCKAPIYGVIQTRLYVAWVHSTLKEEKRRPSQLYRYTQSVLNFLVWSLFALENPGPSQEDREKTQGYVRDVLLETGSVVHSCCPQYITSRIASDILACFISLEHVYNLLWRNHTLFAPLIPAEFLSIPSDLHAIVCQYNGDAGMGGMVILMGNCIRVISTHTDALKNAITSPGAVV